MCDRNSGRVQEYPGSILGVSGQSLEFRAGCDCCQHHAGISRGLRRDTVESPCLAGVWLESESC